MVLEDNLTCRFGTRQEAGIQGLWEPWVAGERQDSVWLCVVYWGGFRRGYPARLGGRRTLEERREEIEKVVENGCDEGRFKGGDLEMSSEIYSPS